MTKYYIIFWGTILSQPPEFVFPVPRLTTDLIGLTTLFDKPTPPKRTIRTKLITVVWYGFGNAAGTGFGDVLVSTSGIHYRYGIWGNDLEGKLSNYRKLVNLSSAVEEHVATLQFLHLTRLIAAAEDSTTQNNLTQAEFFLFTDNGVAEGAFYRGTSSNKNLFELVLCLKQLELAHALRLHIIHIAGTRIQSQGTDGLSWGTPLILDPTHQVPLHLGAHQRSSSVISWCQGWFPDTFTLRPLAESDWFFTGHCLTMVQPIWTDCGIRTWQTPSRKRSSGYHRLQLATLRLSSSVFRDKSAQNLRTCLSAPTS